MENNSIYGNYTIETEKYVGDAEKDVVLAQPAEPVVKKEEANDKIPLCKNETYKKYKCDDNFKCVEDGKCGDDCKCGDKTCDHCANITCGEHLFCAENKGACAYKYNCGEGDCNCFTKTFCPDDELCAKNHKTFLENVLVMNANFISFFDCCKIEEPVKCADLVSEQVSQQLNQEVKDRRILVRTPMHKAEPSY